MSALLGWLWQGTALALAVGLALRLLPTLGASARHVVWWLTLLAVLALPVAHLVQGAGATAGGGTGIAAEALAVQPLLVPAPPDWAVATLLGAWLGTVVLGLIRVLRGLDLLRRLRLGACPIDAGRENRLPLWRETRGRGRRCDVRASADVGGACALGLWRPAILVSRDLLDTLDDEHLDQVVMHEHAHLARYDDWTRLAQALVQSVAGLHPAVALISRQIDMEREAACDDRVVAQTGAARRYAACLATVGETSLSQRGVGEATLLPGMTRSNGALLRRVARLLDPRRGHAVGLDPATGVVTMAALLLAVVSSRHAGPMIELVATDVVALASPAEPPPALPAYPAGVPPADAEAPGPAKGLGAAQDGARASATAAPVAGQSGPPASSQQAKTDSPAPVALETTGWRGAIEPAGQPSVAPTTSPSAAVRAGDDSGGWAALAATGTSIGSGSKKAGVAVAGFFSRAARTTAASF